MRRLLNRAAARALTAALICLAQSPAAAQNASAPFTFAALGDTPYTRDEEERFPDLIAEMNREDLAFVVHVGDFKAANARCDDGLFLQRREWFEYSRHPFVFVPGDNEWTDCRRFAAGRYEPLERLRKLRELFFRSEESLGQRRMKLARQSPDYPEHARWRHGEVLFVTLNVPGGANNARHMPEEFRSRNAAVEQWLERSFRLAREDGLRAVVVLMQANPWASPTGHYFGYRELLAALARETREFRGEVLLVHGDTHRHRVDRPLRRAPGDAPLANFTRVEVFGSPSMNWVRIRVSEEAGRVRFVVTPGS
ncbi:MAG: hypothetical protein HYV99_09270 [Betaproteobacteria bacterium]|nr:hypothetical protein [Betaproteobacteria bacterium]MBI2510134.1 hypothetical protein [Betaproteobacteria bacterium]